MHICTYAHIYMYIYAYVYSSRVQVCASQIERDRLLNCVCERPVCAYVRA